MSDLKNPESSSVARFLIFEQDRSFCNNPVLHHHNRCFDCNFGCSGVCESRC